MALPINIKELLNGKVVEWERLEFKKGWNPEDTLHSICAFANDINNWGGGYIIIGVEEKNDTPILPPNGLQQNQLDSIQKKLHEICHRLTPKYFPVVEPYFYMNKHILIVWVPGGDVRPYKAPETLMKGSQYFSWIRRYSKSVKAKNEEEQLLFSLSEKIPYDDRINHHADINNFELNLIKEFLQEINSDFTIQSNTSIEEISHVLQIGRGPQEYFKPVNVGLLFFTSDPAKFFPYTKIEIVEFLDEIGDNLIEKTFTGPLHIQIRSCLQYIKNSIIKEKVQKVNGKAESNRLYNYPYEAIEEALVNAVYHKSYELREPVEVSIKQDMIEILSFPGPLPPIDNDSLKQFRVTARCYRNRRIGDFLKELHLTEGKATGFPKIRRSMKINGSPDPIFEMDKDRTYFLTTLQIHPNFKLGPSSDQVTDQVGTKSVLSRDQVMSQANLHENNELIGSLVLSLSQACPKLAKPEIHAIILLYCFDPRKITEIMAIVKQTNRSRFKKIYIDKLIELNFLEYTNPNKVIDPNQKYRLTEPGKLLLEKIEK